LHGGSSKVVSPDGVKTKKKPAPPKGRVTEKPPTQSSTREAFRSGLEEKIPTAHGGKCEGDDNEGLIRPAVWLIYRRGENGLEKAKEKGKIVE